MSVTPLAPLCFEPSTLANKSLIVLKTPASFSRWFLTRALSPPFQPKYAFLRTSTYLRVMLATPLLPATSLSLHSSEEPSHFRPAKDIEPFTSLLPPHIESIEGSSSGTLANLESKYEPINGTPKVAKPEVHLRRNPPTQD